MVNRDNFPQPFVSTVLGTFGDKGAAWLNDLPVILLQTAQRLDLKPLPHFPNLTYNYVAPAVQPDGREVVLKLGPPNPGLASEIHALVRYSGAGSAGLQYSDVDAGVLVLERLIPGTPLTPMANDKTDSEATSIACSVMRSLRLAATERDHGMFRSVSELGEGFPRLRSEFGGGVGPFPQQLVAAAESIWAELSADCTDPVLLHGDLHHDNIISASRAPWLCIDPKGYIGDPAFETGALIRNLWQDRHAIANPARTIQRRIHQMSDELELERDRVRSWALAQAVLSVWWSYEDHDPNWQSSLDVAEMIAASCNVVE